MKTKEAHRKLARLAFSKVFAISESGSTFRSAGMVKCEPLILRAHAHKLVRGSQWSEYGTPELLREVHALVHRQPAVCRAADVVRIVFILHRTRTGLELAVEEIVEALVLGHVRLCELVELDAVGVDERGDVLDGLGGVVSFTLLELLVTRNMR